MPTKLSRYAEGIMEAVWLAALVVVPVFFNVYSSRIFEPDKLALLRSLALVSAGAWIIKIFDQGGWRLDLPHRSGEPWYRTLVRTPLILPAVLLTAVILLSTLLSVTPRISFWGSYQRLQGTYTTLAYILIFASLVGNLRRREQVERLIVTAILASLPVGLYGILQRFEIDPVPWGGDVSRRIASNMGNSIFVAAYLILVFPLTLGRIVDSFRAILTEENESLAAHVARGTVYVFMAAIQLIALYLSSSRGPLLGLIAGSFFLFVLLSLFWRLRWLTISTIAVAAAIAAFLVIFNIPNGPFESLKEGRTGLARLGQVFQTDSGTGLVRILIWGGTSQLVAPHEPIEYPDGATDRFNFLRPLIGYGPEAMYVAYNPFYPPQLANIEARNASPDRSHNETWDAMVISGVLGLVVYLALFTSIFYYGLLWLGMISSRRQRSLFFGLFLGGGVLSAIGFVMLAGIEYFGVGLPFGMLIGLLGYLAIVSLVGGYLPPESGRARLRAMTIMIFLGAMIAHFTEIHFGIAIAATRTYFWIYAGVLVAVGHIMTHQGAYGEAAQSDLAAYDPAEESALEQPQAVVRQNKKRRRLRGRRQRGRTVSQPWIRQAVIGGVIIAFLLATLGYDFITNSGGQSSLVSEIIWRSLTTLPNRNYITSYGILVLFITLWLAAGALLTAENIRSAGKDWHKLLLGTLGVSASLSLVFWLWHGLSLVSVVRAAANADPGFGFVDRIMAQASQLEGLLSNYYLFLFLMILLAARFLPASWPAAALGRSMVGTIVAPAVLIAVIFLTSASNLRIIQADMAFKLADSFARGEDPESWRLAIELYNRARDYAPSEDHYYLFLGRGYLELARILQEQNPAEANSLLDQAEQDLERAQQINPLNTDHTANLARLHRFRSALALNPAERQALAQEASQYYARALAMSPNNAVIWNEWAILHINELNEPARGLEILDYSLQLDPYYNGTPALLGEYYYAQARQQGETGGSDGLLDTAGGYFRQAISLTKNNQSQSVNRFNYLSALANVRRGT